MGSGLWLNVEANLPLIMCWFFDPLGVSMKASGWVEAFIETPRWSKIWHESTGDGFLPTQKCTNTVILIENPGWKQTEKKFNLSFFYVSKGNKIINCSLKSAINKNLNSDGPFVGTIWIHNNFTNIIMKYLLLLYRMNLS